MATHKRGPTEGGSGGRRGHSNMNHWGVTEEIKASAHRRRRIEAKAITNGQASNTRATRRLNP